MERSLLTDPSGLPLLNVREFAIERREGAGGMVQVAVVGEIDMDTASELDDVLNSALADRATSAVVVDLSGVSFLDSTGIHVLLARHHAAAESNVSLVLVNVRHNVSRVLEITGVLRLLTVASAG
jgi:anti-sigma B factor antagonist